MRVDRKNGNKRSHDTNLIVSGVRRSVCAECRSARTMGKKRCSHGKVKRSCVECTPCPHGNLKSSCAKCKPCPNGKAKRNSAVCTPCPHGRVKRNCMACKAARADLPSSKRIKREPESSPEIKQDPEPFTIQSYFGFDDGR